MIIVTVLLLIIIISSSSSIISGGVILKISIWGTSVTVSIVHVWRLGCWPDGCKRFRRFRV